MKAADWIDKVKTTKGWESDYRAAKELGLSRNTISNYRGGARLTLDEETAKKVAFALGVDPVGIIIDQVAERSKDTSLSTALHAVARQLCILCKVSTGVRRGPPGDVKKSQSPGQMLKSALSPLHFLGSPAYLA